MVGSREFCYNCSRPLGSCVCKYVNQISTDTKFVILMHPKEHRKTKNGTGRMTHLSLANSEIHVGIDFSGHAGVNGLINDPENLCFILYPGEKSIDLGSRRLDKEGKRLVIFIIDSTWPCSKKMLRLSKNLQKLPRVSFQAAQGSKFAIKRPPTYEGLSTIESTLFLLELLKAHEIEDISKSQLNSFLLPFNEMVRYQIECAKNSTDETTRYKAPKVSF